MSHPYFHGAAGAGPSSPPPRGAQRTHGVPVRQTTAVVQDITWDGVVTCRSAAATPYPSEPIKPPRLERKQLVHHRHAAVSVGEPNAHDGSDFNETPSFLPTPWQLTVGERHEDAENGGPPALYPIATLFDGPDVPLVFDTTERRRGPKKRSNAAAAAALARTVGTPSTLRAAPLTRPCRRTTGALPTPAGQAAVQEASCTVSETTPYATVLSRNRRTITASSSRKRVTVLDDGASLRPWTPPDGDRCLATPLSVSPIPTTMPTAMSSPADDATRGVVGVATSSTATTTAYRETRLLLQCVALLSRQAHAALAGRYFHIWTLRSLAASALLPANDASRGAPPCRRPVSPQTLGILQSTADAMRVVAARHLRLRYFLSWRQRQTYRRWARGASLSHSNGKAANRTPSDMGPPPCLVGATPPPSCAIDASQLLFTPASPPSSIRQSMLSDDALLLFTPTSPPPSCHRVGVERSPPPPMLPLTGEVATCHEAVVDGRTVHLCMEDVERASARQGSMDLSDLVVASPRCEDAPAAHFAECVAEHDVPLTRIKFFHGSL